ERGLDSTTTRSLMGNAYPNPGLYGKFYDQDQEPLVEVIRDTVGRHDTFGLACYAKYYEDMGYFGHVNCTDNFNEQLLPYTIEPRKGWPALNLFYNTSFDADNLLVSDEPWSRPGDYVLLRALTDLVCLSSACPDDIDPANAWNPTEIHVRVYPAKERFTAAIAHRATPDAEPKLTKDTGFRPRTGDLTGRFTDYNGYWLPTAYDNHGAIDEYWACRERAARRGLHVWIKESTDELHNVAVQGPTSRDVLSSLIWTAPTQTPFTELGWFRFSVARLGEPQGLPLIVSRTGYTGELGYELFCHPRDAVELWDALVAAGDVTPLGLEALDMIRIEAGLVFAGAEFDDQIDPFEA